MSYSVSILLISAMITSTSMISELPTSRELSKKATSLPTNPVAPKSTKSYFLPLRGVTLEFYYHEWL